LEQWPRLAASVNNEELPYVAVNEVAVLPVNPFKSSELTERIDDIVEHFTGSGVIVATPRGSTGWFWSITAGVVIHPELRAIGVCNREVFEKYQKPVYHHLIVPDSKVVEIVPTRHEYRVNFNPSAEESTLVKAYDTIRIYKSEKPLNVVRLE